MRPSTTSPTQRSLLSLRNVLRSAVVLATLTLGVASGPVFADEAVDAEVAAMKAAEKAGDEAKCLGKMEGLKDSSDPKVTDAMKGFAQHSKNDKIAIFAMKWMAGKGDVEFGKWLITKIDLKDGEDLSDPKKGRPEIYKALLDTLLLYRKNHQDVLKQALDKLGDVIKKYISTEGDYATRAIRVYGAVQLNVVVNQLLKWGEDLDSRSGGKGGGGGGGKKARSEETRKAEEESKKAVLATLNELCAQDIADIDTWKKWWAENSKTFKFPDLNAPAGDAPAAAKLPDPSALTEWKDPGYGFGVKRPESPGWTFALPEESLSDARLKLLNAPPDDAKYMQAVAYFFIWNTKRTGPKDVKGFADWAAENVYKTQLQMDEKKPVEIKQIKLSNVDCTMMSGKGEGIGIKQGWGTIERRFYILKLDDHNLLYVDCTVRLGAEEAVMKDLWESIEKNVTVSAPGPKK